jgi:hypothetical protein
MEELEQKLFILYLNGDNLSLQAVAPSTQVERNELQKLDRQGLSKFIVIDTSSSYLFHKRAIRRLINNFHASKNPQVALLDRSKNSRGLIHIHAANIRLIASAFSFEKHNITAIENNLTMKNNQGNEAMGRRLTEMMHALKNKFLNPVGEQNIT